MIVANDYMLGATFFDGKKDMFPIPKQYRNNKIEEVQDLRACGMFQIYICGMFQIYLFHFVPTLDGGIF